MKNKILTKFLILLIGLFLFSSISPAQRIIKTKFKVTRVYATVSPKSYKGKCPFKFDFTGYITTNGKATVKYKWIRKDGARAPVKAIYFNKAGTKKVTTSWYLGGAGKVYKNYWEAVQILSPNSITSNKALFSLYCKKASKTPVVKAIPKEKATHIAHPTGALKGKKLGPKIKKKERKTPVVKAIPKPKERKTPVVKAIPKPTPTPPSEEVRGAGQSFNTGKVTVKGNNRNWTRIYGVKANYAIKVLASGIVDFGCMFGRCRDSSTAGVTGNKFAKFVTDFGKSLIEITTQPWESVNQIKQLFKKRGPVNYDQGGVWIKITDIGGNEVTAIQLYYYWHNVYNKVGGVCFSRDVIVWAKAHDGGRNPESTSSYGDNKGNYQVWLVLTENKKVPGTF